MHGHGLPPGFINALVLVQYLIFLSDPALAIRHQYLSGVVPDDSIGFGFSKITLQASPINDIYDWMTQYHPDLLPPGDPFPPSPAPKQVTVPEKKEGPSKPKTEFLHVSDEG
jgi:hypothetical protein